MIFFYEIFFFLFFSSCVFCWEICTQNPILDYECRFRRDENGLKRVFRAQKPYFYTIQPDEKALLAAFSKEFVKLESIGVKEELKEFYTLKMKKVAWSHYEVLRKEKKVRLFAACFFVDSLPWYFISLGAQDPKAILLEIVEEFDL